MKKIRLDVYSKQLVLRWSIRTMSQTEGENYGSFTYCGVASKRQKQAPLKNKINKQTKLK